jgi:hypothetical protein
MSQAQVAGLVLFGFSVVGVVAIYAVLTLTQKTDKKSHHH